MLLSRLNLSAVVALLLLLAVIGSQAAWDLSSEEVERNTVNDESDEFIPIQFLVADKRFGAFGNFGKVNTYGSSMPSAEDYHDHAEATD